MHFHGERRDGLRLVDINPKSWITSRKRKAFAPHTHTISEITRAKKRASDIKTSLGRDDITERRRGVLKRKLDALTPKVGE